MSKLVIEDQRGRKTNVPLVRDSITIGREEGNTIRLNERNVSRVHLELLRDEGEFYAVDRSRYGSTLNGQRFTGKTRLYQGDVIFVGDYRLVVDLEVPTPEVRPTPPLAWIDFGFPRLIYQEDGALVASWRLRGPVILGSSPRAHLRIEGPGVLAQHIHLLPEDGRWVARAMDRASTFRVNDRVVQRWVLTRGDRLTLGGKTLVWIEDNQFSVVIAPIDIGRHGAEIPRQRTWEPVGMCASGPATSADAALA